MIVITSNKNELDSKYIERLVEHVSQILLEELKAAESSSQIKNPKIDTLKVFETNNINQHRGDIHIHLHFHLGDDIRISQGDYSMIENVKTDEKAIVFQNWSLSMKPCDFYTLESES